MRRHRFTLNTILAVGVLVILSVAGGVLAPAARATSGAATIAAAPQLPIGATFVGGAVAHDEYWRVTLAAGDTLTIDYQPTNGGEVDLDIYKPSVTDYTIGNASEVAGAWTTGKDEFTWTATGQGSWILKVYSYDGYQLTAHVQHVFATRLTPALGRRGAIVTINGRGFGGKRGKSSIKFGAATCTKYLAWSNTRIRCRVPRKAKLGKLKIRVVTTAGTSNTKAFNVVR